LARECPKRSVSGARDLVCALRSLLRYLHLAGLIEAPLVWAVPSVADLRDRTLPRGLEPGAVKKLLASRDRRRLVGRRDFAILLLLSRLGLRAGEVAGLRPPQLPCPPSAHADPPTSESSSRLHLQVFERLPWPSP
jgi:integrase